MTLICSVVMSETRMYTLSSADSNPHNSRYLTRPRYMCDSQRTVLVTYIKPTNLEVREF